MIGKLEVLLAGTLTLGLVVTGAAQQQSVIWAGQSNVSVRGNTIEKIGGCDGCDDAGAQSRQVIRSGNGFVEFRVDDPYVFWAAGLSRAGAVPQFNQIDFAWRFNGNGRADVIERGAYQPNSDAQANQGDMFQVAAVNGRVQYIRNGSVVHESSRRATYPLAFTAALGTVGARVTNARIDTSGRNVVGTSGRYRNGDGRLSRGEWAQAGPTSRFDPRYDTGFDPRYDTGDYEAYVDAGRRWTDTGVWAEAGDLVTFVADGTIELNQSGASSAPSGSPYTTQSPPLRSAAVGLLIARVGNSAVIPVGSNRTVRAPVSGEILLGVNDDVLEDNSGEYRVRISVRSR
jgi:PA-IL-like protein